VKRHVALAGFMASGKSTIGRKLARRLGWRFVDTDALVVAEHGPIAEIFGSEGETAFRRYERAAVDAALHSPERSVVALGGGALTVAATRALVHENAYCVFIRVSPEQILARIRRSREVRPVLGARPSLASIRALYERRMADYARAELAIEASRRKDREVVAEIAQWLHDKNCDAGAAS